MTKKTLGQYYTTTNPFGGEAYEKWKSIIPNTTILEPFAGAGHLFKYIDANWVGYDIQPNHQNIIQRDTIKDFPKGFKVCITNPPYLAKNSASRRKLNVSIKRSDLYLDCLELMLENCDYVCAIIPSTFYRTGLFRERLFAWDKMDCLLFNDTDAPAGVAYFVPEKTNTSLYVNGESIIKAELNEKIDLKFNVEYGNYVLNGIDTTLNDNISISDDILSFNKEKYLKNTSRNYVLFYSPVPLDIEKTNKNIKEWRLKTKDFNLTSFKSLQKSGKYRKRISFNEVSRLVIKK